MWSSVASVTREYACAATPITISSRTCHNHVHENAKDDETNQHLACFLALFQLLLSCFLPSFFGFGVSVLNFINIFFFFLFFFLQASFSQNQFFSHGGHTFVSWEAKGAAEGMRAAALFSPRAVFFVTYRWRKAAQSLKDLVRSQDGDRSTLVELAAAVNGEPRSRM